MCINVDTNIGVIYGATKTLTLQMYICKHQPYMLDTTYIYMFSKTLYHTLFCPEPIFIKDNYMCFVKWDKQIHAIFKDYYKSTTKLKIV